MKTCSYTSTIKYKTSPASEDSYTFPLFDSSMCAPRFTKRQHTPRADQLLHVLARDPEICLDLSSLYCDAELCGDNFVL